MDKNNFLTLLQPIFEEVFKIENLKLSESMQAKDIDGWDSLNHALLMDAIEKRFDIEFDLMDMLNMTTVGEICDRIIVKQKSAES